MFLQTNVINTGLGDITRAFVKSLNINAFPCGRRRGLIEANRYMPFDPEARLNTEHNQRKTVGTSGYNQSFISDISFTNRLTDTTQFQPDGSATFVLAGYSFTLHANIDSMTISGAIDGCDYLGKAIMNALGDTSQAADTERLYVNIKLATVPLYEGNAQDLYYNSWVLRDQTPEIAPRTCLDLLSSITNANKEKSEHYYFSGLSFSRLPVAHDTKDLNKIIDTVYYTSSESVDRQELDVSLCILIKPAGSSTWQINQKALLPSVSHGEDIDSVEVSSFNATKVVKQGGKPVTVLEVEAANAEHDKPRLKFTFGGTNQ